MLGMRTVIAEHFQHVKFFDLPGIDDKKANAELRAKVSVGRP